MNLAVRKQPGLPIRAASRRRAAGAHGAFTLIEMLTVLAIIIVLVAILGPAVNSIVHGPLLTQASDEVVGLFNLAQQTATARNQPVAVRFYQYADASAPGETPGSADTGKYRAMQILLVNEDGTFVPLRAVAPLPLGVIADMGLPLDPAASISTLLLTTQRKTWPPNDPAKTPLPKCGQNYNCCEFRFRPDGSTNLAPASNWYVTLHNGLDGDGRTVPPANFVTVQIDPVNGTSSVYRP